jgi:hypothetical protein
MLLPPNLIRFGQPCSELIVYFAGLRQPERVQMVARRERLDPTEAGMLEPSGENEVAIQPVATWSDLRERHAHLECDPRFLGKDPDRAQFFDRGDNSPVECANLGRLAPKMVRQRVPAAGVRLVAIREESAAFRTSPQRTSSGHESSCRSYTQV